MVQKPEGWYTGIVSIWNLPKDKVYIDLETWIKKELVDKLKEIFQTKTKLAKTINESFDNIRNFFDRGQTKSLVFIEKLISELEKHGIDSFDHKTIEKNVICIQAKNGKKIINPRFPINFNTRDGAILISAMFHDGGIIKSTLCPFYRNYRKQKIENIKTVFENVIGKVNFSLQNNNTKIVFPNIFGIILINGLGLESGAKTTLNMQFPQFILNSTEEVRASFLRQAFDDEGNINLGRGKSRQIAFYQSVDVSKIDPKLREKIKLFDLEEFAPNIMKGIKNLLLSLGIKVNKLRFDQEWVSKNGKISYIWKLTITHKNNIKKFNEKIGFGISEKQKILDIALNTYVTNRPYPEIYKAP